ncbi:LysM peptidoglycan-binding domain-containing protein [Desulfovibrio mangrovi]|uniref:LysM peptidoglycan-binding domain-containing protein n=1 Tax=Desulfovibrio mangrovi TaxID=2976983 RepID=UPI002247AC54|nr:LysM peptidoglycan-binding domain-containing protein [Desulfovibrio mangrovi]UZP66339.1 LysM peptidoglycan-binding domain-containing protein [Desulfovibrio mangrovi]
MQKILPIKYSAMLLIGLMLVIALGACTPKQSLIGEEPVVQAPVDEAVCEPGRLNAAGEPDVPSEDVASLDETPGQDSSPLTAEEQEALNTRLNINIDMDDSDRQVVEQYFKYFTHSRREVFERYLERAEMYLPYARKVFKEKGLPDEVVYLAFVESGFNPNAYSRAGAAGMWQFMPYTGRKYGLKYDWWIDERRDPFKATHAAADYLNKLYADFGDWYLAIAAYNAGEGKIGRAMKDTGAESFFELTQQNYKLSHKAQLRQETRHYVPKFLAIVKIMRNLKKLGFKPIAEDCGIELAEVRVKGGTDLLSLANACSMEWKTFSSYNPAFSRQVSPPDHDATVYLPAKHLATAGDFIASAKSRPYAGWKAYSIKSGDSWYGISRKFNVPVTVLKSVNKSSSNVLRIGQRVMIPGGGSSTAVAWDMSRAKTRSIAQKRGNYKVQTGDTLSAISRETGVSIQTLMEANGLTAKSMLKVGQKLYVPDNSFKKTVASRKQAEEVKKSIVYKVRRGESLWSIARKFGVSHQDVMRWNQLDKQSQLHPGDQLKLFVN